jgi:hypothetical protein
LTPHRTVLVLAVAVAASAAGCKRGKATPAECAAMIDRYVDMTIASDPQLAALPPAQADVARQMKREVKKGEKSYRQVEEQCEREVTRGELDCAMKAPTPNDWEACIE